MLLLVALRVCPRQKLAIVFSSVGWVPASGDANDGSDKHRSVPAQISTVVLARY
jgi:hypothetical protein